jgi:serine/threonine protein kinase
MLYELLTGNPPFSGDNIHKLYANILRGEYSIPSDLSIDAIVLIKSLLQTNAENRPTIKEVKSSAWLVGRFTSTEFNYFNDKVISYIVSKGTNRLELEIGIK